MRARRRIIIISAVVIVHVRNIYPVCDYFKPYFIVERVYVQVVGVIQTECDHAVIVMTFQECVAVFHVDPCPVFVGSVVRPVNIRDKDLVVRHFEQIVYRECQIRGRIAYERFVVIKVDFRDVAIRYIVIDIEQYRAVKIII